ncbi:MAG: histidine utilization repressor [Devosia sp.]|nr:histidine utilization repressor [Devosia sp.]
MTKIQTGRPEGEATAHYQKIADEIQAKIISGEWPVGHRIPFEVDLATQYGVSRMTVNKAVTQLARSGLVERVKRGGTFVSAQQTQSAVLDIGDIRSEAASLNLPYAFRVVEKRARKARQADLALLDVAPGQKLLDLVCIHKAGKRPFCLERRLINLATVPQAETADFADVPPSQWLLKQIPWTSAEHRIHAAAATGEDAAALEITEGTACLVVERRTWSDAGPVTRVTLTYPGDRHALVATFTPSS